MCGIVGEVRFDGKDADMTFLSSAIDHMHSRGPNGSGLVAYDGVGLGHRRLSIFDTSSRSQQPMVSSDLGLSITFNGAIYNFRELRSELIALGYEFQSSGDTEVVLKAYHAWGLDMVQRLNGMFAIGIWDRDKRRLVLIRDRMGIKPLFYSFDHRGARFSSSLSAITASLQHPRLDPESLQLYLAFHVVPEPRTLVKSVSKLLPGSTLVIDQSGAKHLRSYWNVSFNDDRARHDRSDSEWEDTTESLLQEAVQRRMEADVPVGILLSGGLDSTLILSLAQEKIPAQKIKTFTIGFDDHVLPGENEHEFADEVARHFGTDHRRIQIPVSKLETEIINCIRQMSEPIVSHDAIGFFLLSKGVSQHVAVALSGQGADELFAGYSWFQREIKSQAKQNKRALIRELRQSLCDRDHSEYLGSVNGDLQVNYDIANDYLSIVSNRSGSGALVDVCLTYESTFGLSNGPLTRVDNMAMAFGLEARVPFLDHHVVSHATHMPLSQKLPMAGKAVLKRIAAKRQLPSSIISRRKGYFPVSPVQRFGDFRWDGISDQLRRSVVSAAGIFDPDYVDRLKAEPHTRHSATGVNKLWQVAVLQLWCQLHGVRS